MGIMMGSRIRKWDTEVGYGSGMISIFSRSTIVMMEDVLHADLVFSRSTIAMMEDELRADPHPPSAPSPRGKA